MPNTKGKWATPEVEDNKIAADIRAAVNNAMGRKPITTMTRKQSKKEY